MIRILTAAALAAAFVAGPAAAQSVRIATAGKSTAQVQAEVVKAAKNLCAAEAVGASFPQTFYKSCVKVTVANALKGRPLTTLAALEL
jgi:hypothetical protein